MISTFEYFTNCLMESSPDAEQLWIRKSYTELALHIFGLFSIRTIQEAVKFLEAHRIIAVQSAAVAVGGRNSYLFDYQLVQQFLRTNTVLDGKIADVAQAKLPTYAGKIADRTSDEVGVPITLPQAKLPTAEGGVYKEVKELEIEEEIEPPPPHSLPNPSEAENQESKKEENSAKEEKAGYIVSPVEYLTQKPIRELTYVPFGRAKKLSKRALREQHRYGAIGALPARQSISTGGGATGIPQNAPQPTGTQNRGYQWCIAKWNELVPRRGVRHIEAYKTEIAFYDPVMVGAWEEICQKAAAKIDQLDATAGEDSGWLTLEWVVGEKNNKPNWRKMLVQQEWKKRGGVPTYKDGKLVL